ncbi:MAG TPA: gephyrin-like molybdotransferase Glp, partial [Candidatus Limnocylindrales bacterium]
MTATKAPHLEHDERARVGLMSVDEALASVLRSIDAPVGTEEVPVAEALGRVLAEPVIAPISLPPWDNSAMDGYAIRAADTEGVGPERPVVLQVIGEVRAGSRAASSVREGTALRIATGARIPPGADAVVPVENTYPSELGTLAGPASRDAAGPLPTGIELRAAVPVGGSIRSSGSDVQGGAAVLEAGVVLTPPAVALASGVGAARVTVYRRPLVAVLATGDEVREPGSDLGPAGIPDANRPGLVAAVRAAGGEAVDLGIAADDLEEVVSRLRQAIDQGVDVVIVSGGVSVGPYDVVKAAFDDVGHIEMWRVAVQPGKPFAFGVANSVEGARGALLFGLPGNPVSSLVTFELFVRPAIRRLAGLARDHLLRPTDRAVLSEPASKSHGRRTFLRVRAVRDEKGTPARDAAGRVRVRLAGGQGSHVLSAIAIADALAVVPEE